MPTATTTRSPCADLADVGAWLTPEQRREALAEGNLSISDLAAWSALWPEDVPLINGELPWIALTLADNDDE
jgi:hypothetical protein